MSPARQSQKLVTEIISMRRRLEDKKNANKKRENTVEQLKNQSTPPDKELERKAQRILENIIAGYYAIEESEVSIPTPILRLVGRASLSRFTFGRASLSKLSLYVRAGLDWSPVK